MVVLVPRLRRSRLAHRMDSTSDRLMQSLFTNRGVLVEAEVEYLAAAEQGDLANVQKAIHESNVNINCVDSMGRSALELALMQDQDAVVEYLLPMSNLQSIEDGLLHAISRDNVRMCELFLDHPLYKKNRIQLSSSDGFYQHDNDTPRMRLNIAPIVLAAQRNNFYIVQLLILRGASIAPPHDYFCDCIECSNMRVFDSVKYSRSRLDTYRALASPAYISLKSEDPIHTAFELSNELIKLSEIEKEYKSEYRKLSDGCKDYSCELLELCRSTEEIIAILNEDDEPGGDCSSLSRVKMAIKYDQKRFIAHPTCQRQLISFWYMGFPWMRHQVVFVKLLAVPLTTLMLPLVSLAFLVAPNTKFGKQMRSPFVKFLTHTCAYIVFLILVFMATLRGGSGNPWLDMACRGFTDTLPDSVVFIMILIWVLGMLLHECRQLWREGPKNYLTDWWNWMDSSLIFLYLAYYSLQIVVYVGVRSMEPHVRAGVCPNASVYDNCREMGCEVEQASRNWTQCNPGGACTDIDYLYTAKSPPGEVGDRFDLISEANQISDIFFALANVLSFARIAHLLPANEQLGPLLVSFGRMLHDVMRFGVVFILVLSAFMCGLTSLYRVHQCENKHFSRIDLTLSSLFWATFGMGDTKATQIDHRYLAVDNDMITTHTLHHPLVVLTGYLLFWSYIIGSVVVLLNMLIAMMSNSFQEIYDDRDVEWKFARAKLWIDFFEDGCTLPAPFNLIPNPKYVWYMIRWCRTKCSETREEPPVQMAYIYNRRKNGMTEGTLNNIEMPPKPETLYQRITQRLIQRYIYKKQCEFKEKKQSENELVELKMDVMGLSNDVSKLRHEIGYIRTSFSDSRIDSIRQRNGVNPGNSRARLEV